MLLKSLYLQHFRNYREFSSDFKGKTNLIVGPNAAGKTNLLEAIFFLSTGRSFKAERDDQLIRFGEQAGRMGAIVRQFSDTEEDTKLQAVIYQNQGVVRKKFEINGVAKRRNDFSGVFTSVLFLPTDLDIVIGQPGARRRFLDDVLEQVDGEYSLALNTYTRALRQRNALLSQARESGLRNEKAFEYWDLLLIRNGQVVSKKREEFILFINKREKELFGFELIYDRSEISRERLEKYRAAEMGVGVTLVGPHRDDIKCTMYNVECTIPKGEVKSFASRGQQRLVVLELRLAQIAYIEERTGERPVLLLDDIFSELDDNYAAEVLKIVGKQQSVITTTHREFAKGLLLDEGSIIELRNEIF